MASAFHQQPRHGYQSWDHLTWLVVSDSMNAFYDADQVDLHSQKSVDEIFLSSTV